MPEFIFKGEIVLHGVDFFVNAENEQDALQKAAHGKYDHYEVEAAETADWHMNLTTCKPND